jgi:hypothetical protein
MDDDSTVIANRERVTRERIKFAKELKKSLKMGFENTASWRRQQAVENPDEKRNLAAAALLDKLAQTVDDISPAWLDAYGYWKEVADADEMLRQVGFQLAPEDADEFVKSVVKKESPQAAA